MKRTTLGVRTIVAIAMVTCVSGSVVLAAMEEQPADKHSFLIQNDGKGIRDDDFADIMAQRLFVPVGGQIPANPQKNVLDAKFIFEQCYGGGMLDDLRNFFTFRGLKWVGGSASKWDEPSVGQVSTAENNARPGKGLQKYDAIWVANPPQDFWTEALLPELPKDQPLLTGIDKATSTDKVGPSPTKPPYDTFERGQSIFGNAGDTIKLKDPAAQSYHAILWAGSPDAMRHYNDINNIRDSLIAAWGNPATNANVTISVLFGDGAKKPDGTNLPAAWGAQPATRDKLKTTMAGLPLNANEEFFFYSSDHGGESTTIQAPTDPPKMVLPGSLDREPFLLAAGELDGMRRDDNNTAILTVDYAGVLSPNADQVSLNGMPLGYLDPSRSTMDFLISDESILSLSNFVDITNGELSSFGIRGKSFFTGAISTNPLLVPEPATLGLLLMALAALRASRHRR